MLNGRQKFREDRDNGDDTSESIRELPKWQLTAFGILAFWHPGRATGDGRWATARQRTEDNNSIHFALPGRHTTPPGRIRGGRRVSAIWPHHKILAARTGRHRFLLGAGGEGAAQSVKKRIHGLVLRKLS